MKAEAAIVASTQGQGREMLTQAFNDFYEHTNWAFTEEPTAKADYVTIAGEVLSWRIAGTAEEGGA